MLKPEIFKMLLIRSKKTRKYAEYYILLESAIKYFSDYQILKLNKKINLICGNRVLDLENQDKKERLVIIKLCNPLVFNKIVYDYQVFRGQTKRISDLLQELNDDFEILIDINTCHANNLFNAVKEQMKGNIIFLKKYLYIVDGKCVEWSYESDDMKNKYNHVSINSKISLCGITEKTFIHTINLINSQRWII